MKTKKNVTLFLLLMFGSLILINVISENLFFRLDFTEDNRYTLSKATKNIVDELNEPVTVKAYFSEDVPQTVAKVKTDFKEMLEEYAAISNGMLIYEFINPNQNEETEMQAMQSGIQPILINVREKDQVKQQKAYLGVIVEMGEMTDVIPVMQPGAAMEYTLSKSLKKVSITDKPLVGVLQGHGEPALSEMQQMQSEMSIMYNLEEITLSDQADLNKYNTLAIVAPKDSIPSNHLNRLTEYVHGGGNVLVAINRVEGDLQQSRGLSVSTGLESWLLEMGVQVENAFLIDANCGRVQVRQNNGMFTYSTNVEFPYLPIITNFTDHPVTNGLEAVILPFASSISYTGDTTLQFTSLAVSGQNSGTQPASTIFNVQKQWTKNDFNKSELTVAAALEGQFGAAGLARMVVIGDGDFIVNGAGQAAQQQQADNISLFVNAMDWLADDTGLIALRTKGITARPIDELEDGTKTTLKYLNFLLPIVLIIIYGIFVAQRRKIKRFKRMQPGYID